jgi:preprotein translocase subunit SecY
MKRFIQNLKNIWSVEELRKRILLTLSLILIYRLGSFIMVPGVSAQAVMEHANNAKSGGNALETILSYISGGAFTNVSILSLGIMPYISASIIMQLLGMAVPAVQKMQNEGESGRKQINNYTRILTVIICAAQAPTYIKQYAQNIKGALPGEADQTTLWWTAAILSMVAGSMIAVWIGEKITDKGIGNGVSLLITVGIISRLPSSFIAEVAAKDSLLWIILEVVVFMLIVLGVILIVQGVRKVPLNTAKRVVGGARDADAQGARSYLPLKVNASGVMPIIFAQAIMTIPLMVFAGQKGTLFDAHGWLYNTILAVLIIVFTYFYTAIMISPRKMADDLKSSGGFIPGVRPGEETQEYIDGLVSRITLPGSLFLAMIAILPAIAFQAGVSSGFEYFFGGTSLLIMVGVVLDTLQQIESYLLNRQMDGLMEGSRVRGRREQIPSGM